MKRREWKYMAKNTILVIDDDENISKVIRLYLEKEGMEVLLAADGKTGLELFSKDNPRIWCCWIL